jgi:hypothetical protein
VAVGRTTAHSSRRSSKPRSPPPDRTPPAMAGFVGWYLAHEPSPAFGICPQEGSCGYLTKSNLRTQIGAAGIFRDGVAVAPGSAVACRRTCGDRGISCSSRAYDNRRRYRVGFGFSWMDRVAGTRRSHRKALAEPRARRCGKPIALLLHHCRALSRSRNCRGTGGVSSGAGLSARETGHHVRA